MGLFDIFKSENKETNSNSSELLFDLEKLLEKAEIYESKSNQIKYICKLEKNVFNIFDSLIIIINSEEKKIDPKGTVSIILINSQKKYTHDKAEFVVNTMTKFCNVTDDNWREADANNITEDNWRGRTFIDFKGSSIFIERDDDLGFTLTIAGYNKLKAIL
jgi:hypothetical protein